jgi:hypothetical protein
MDAIDRERGLSAAIQAAASACIRLGEAREVAAADFASATLTPREFLRAAMNFQLAVLEQPDRFSTASGSRGGGWIDGGEYRLPHGQQDDYLCELPILQVSAESTFFGYSAASRIRELIDV